MAPVSANGVGYPDISIIMRTKLKGGVVSGVILLII